jgi:tetratricopeptide (TPR) repeat protein
MSDEIGPSLTAAGCGLTMDREQTAGLVFLNEMAAQGDLMARSRRVFVVAAGLVGAVALLGAGALAWAWPRFFPAPREQARAAYEHGDWAAAASLARETLKTKPADREALRLLARSSGRMGRDAAADAIYKQLGPGTMEPEDYLVIASCLHRQGDMKSAFRLLEKGYEIDPNHAGTLHDLSRFCAFMDKMSRAEELAERLARIPGQEVRADVLLGAIRDKQSDPAGAVEALERALRLDPELRGLYPAPPEARKLLARNYLKIGKPAPARDTLEQVLDAGPDPEASWLLSRSWLQDGRIEEAASALKQAGGYASDDPLTSEPAPYVGSVRCAQCHKAIHRAQQSSRHARTYLAGPDLARLPTPDGPLPDPADPKTIVHQVRRDGDRIGWETRVDGEVARAIVEYAFGSGDRGVTPVGRGEDGRFREIRLSRYGDIDGWDVTAGHPARPEPTTAGQYLGRLLSVDDFHKCLGCHTTDFRAARDRVGPLAVESGIGCERCHGPGGNHLKAVAAGFSDLAIARPRLASAEQVTKLCAECHSPRGRALEPTDGDAVRFQGTTLTWSRCYQESRGGMSCVTCHDPHHDAATSASSYVAKCLACHSDKPRSTGHDREREPSLAEGLRRVVCPVNPTAECLKCHMPVTKSAVPHTAFTDHYIRVHPSLDPVR